MTFLSLIPLIGQKQLNFCNHCLVDFLGSLKVLINLAHSLGYLYAFLIGHLRQQITLLVSFE
jgi:hypothetical protein